MKIYHHHGTNNLAWWQTAVFHQGYPRSFQDSHGNGIGEARESNSVKLLYNYISQLPRERLESAFIDGASHFAVFVRLILPLSVPALASFAIFHFLWARIILADAPSVERPFTAK